MEFAPMFVWSLFTVVLMVSCDGHPLARYKRSDDPAILSATVHSLQTTVAQQAQTISQLQAKIASMETQTTNRFSGLERRIARQETEVAFNTRLTANKPFIGTENLVLDVVALNIGHGYDQTTGIFTAPVAGVYLFSLKVSHTPPGNLHVHIHKNAGVVAEVDASGDDNIDRSSATVVLHLVVGDKVYVQRGDGSANEIQAGYRTTFEGVLVVPDHP